MIDFGQVKQISGRSRETLAKVMVALDERKSDTNPSDLEAIGNLALELGVEIKKGARKEAAAAIGMWLFDGTVEELPGGYDKGELSPNSPVKELKSFPQDLVLVGRSTILIKGLSSRLGIPWSLSKEWAPIARMVLEKKPSASLHRVQFGDVMYTFLQWGKGKIGRAMRRLPSPVRSKMAAIMVNVEERRSRRRLNKKID